MSYDIRAGWFKDKAGASNWITTDDEDPECDVGIVNRHAELIEALTANESSWESTPINETEFELTHLDFGIQILVGTHTIELSIPYYRPKTGFDRFWGCVGKLHQAGATLFDPQLGRALEAATDHSLAWSAYQSCPVPGAAASAPAPRTLNRIQYLVRFLIVMLVLLGGISVWSQLGLEQSLPHLPLALFGLAWAYKIFALDSPRLRSIGYDERIALLNFIPPAVPILQILLFCLSPRE